MPDIPHSNENLPIGTGCFDKVSFPSLPATDIYSTTMSFLPKHEDQIAANDAAVKAGTLPHVEIQNGPVPIGPRIGANEKDITAVNNAAPHGHRVLISANQKPDSVPAEYHNSTILQDLGRGVVREVTEHPKLVVASVLSSVAMGALSTVLAPEVVATTAAFGLLYGAYKYFRHIDGWVHDAQVVWRPKEFSFKEVEQAHRDIENIGGGAFLMAAGAAGGLAGADAAMMLKTSISNTFFNNATAEAAALRFSQPSGMAAVAKPLERITLDKAIFGTPIIPISDIGGDLKNPEPPTVAQVPPQRQ